MAKNRFYDLPDELLTEIYKKVFNNVIKELTSIINIENVNGRIIDKKQDIFDVVDLTIFSYLVKRNSYLYKLSVKDALCFEKVFKILFAYNNLKIIQDYLLLGDEIINKQIYWRGSRNDKYIDMKYTYHSEYSLYKMIYNWHYGQTKTDIFEYLNYENRQGSVYYSWTKKRMIQACMKM